ncbi:MAG: NAD(P)/FAD-dependent oxidoreductase [Planctomycetota bacterium]|jgi:flavin-dependent dehydrogenase
MPKTYDIAVLGATAAGYVSAITLARMGHSVVLADVPKSPTESPLADWLPADLAADCPAVRAVRSTGMEGPFRGFCFHSADGEREATWRRRTVAGYVVRSANLLSALNRSARSLGVDVRRTGAPVRPDLGEHTVSMTLARRTVRARLLLIAKDGPTQVLAGLHLPTRTVPRAQIAACGLDAPLPRGKIRKDMAEVVHVVAVEGAERLGMFFAAGSVLHVRVVSGRGSTPVEASDLSALIARLQQCGLLPTNLDLSRASAALWNPPGGVALDLETLLAKRTLLVGTAGGFVSAVVGQTLDPSIRSAMVAADVAHRALGADQPQDVLAEYKVQWRDPLAERIRPTGTSLQMLMPMVLSNRAMTERFAKTLLSGQSL